MMLLALLALILFPSVASATSDAPDLLRIDVNFTWSGIPFLPGPVTVSGSNVYQHGIGYIDTQGVLTRPNYVVADTGVSSRSYVDIGWSPTHLGINLEAGIPGGVGPDGARFPSGYQHFTAGVSETPGTYTGASFQNESGPLSTYGIFAADSGSVRVVGVPELAILPRFTRHLGGRQLNALVNPSLQRLTAWGAAELLGTKNHGHYIVLPTVILEVEDWCSGITAMKWLMLLALVFGLVSRLGLLGTVMLIFAAALTALEANILRVAAVGYGYGEHPLGWIAVAFGVGQVLLFGLALSIKNLNRDPGMIR